MTIDILKNEIMDVAYAIGMRTMIDDQLEEMVRSAMRYYEDYRSSCRGDATKSAVSSIHSARNAIKTAAWKLAATKHSAVPMDNIDKKLLSYFDEREKVIIIEAANHALREAQNEWKQSHGSANETRQPSRYGEACRKMFKIARKSPVF